ncbi:MAG: guanylate kinase [Ignavibacteria bacterium]|nr:guanylate kinase [Ignavibacteria bacterium]
MKPRGKLLVVSAPSGAGKTTIVKALLAKYPSMLFSVSATTRPRRETEVEGRDYFFLQRQDFERRIAAGELVEWEEIYGNLYGTLKSEVEKALTTGRTMLFDIDVKGGLSIKRMYADDSVIVFIKPPNIAVLRDRLLNRKTEDEATFKRRMDRVAMELGMASQFDYQVVNDNLEYAIAEVDKLVAEHTSQERRV